MLLDALMQDEESKIDYEKLKKAHDRATWRH